VEAIEAIPGMVRGEFDCNGWQWDWWVTYAYSGQTYRLSGSGYYGGISFDKAES
jgi:hypothetical protein